jgi:ribosomal protein S18 acetylase RimI-like enzyme
MNYELTEEEDVEALQVAVRRGIRGADPPAVDARDWQSLGLAIRAPDGTLLGGLYGATMWGWFVIDGLWVAEQLRGEGHGRRLLLAGEAVAVRRGCRGAWLGTFDFQSRGFYERMGYTVFAELANFPAEHTHYHLWKSFSPSPPATRGEARS